MSSRQQATGAASLAVADVVIDVLCRRPAQRAMVCTYNSRPFQCMPCRRMEIFSTEP
jgi:hypothetical protein